MTRKMGKRLKRMSVAKEVRRVFDSMVEIKQIANAPATNVDYTTAGVIYPITQIITQGDNIIDRSGDQITLKYLKCAWFTRNATGTYSGVGVRSIIFCDTMSLGAIPAVTDVLDTAAYISAYNSVNLQNNRFKIISDISYDMVGQTAKAIKTFELPFKLNTKVHYLLGTNVAGANSRHAFYQLIISSAAGAAGQYIYSLYWNMKFTDA